MNEESLGKEKSQLTVSGEERVRLETDMMHSLWTSDVKYVDIGILTIQTAILTMCVCVCVY